MKPYKAMAHIHSLDGEIREITVLKDKDGTNYIVDYGGVKCTAVFKVIPHNVIKREALKILTKKQANFRSNSAPIARKSNAFIYKIYGLSRCMLLCGVTLRFNCQFYADDIYGIIKEKN